MEPTDPKAENEEFEGKAASADQIQLALKALSRDDYLKLSLIAESWVRKYRLHESEMRPRELISEAILRTVEGRRRWPIEKISFLYFLDRTMGSLARHEYDKLKRFAQLDPEQPALGPEESDADDDAKSIRKRLDEAFADDPEALEFLLLKYEGNTVAQVAVAMGKNTNEIEAIKRRANRRIGKLSGSVGKHGEQKAPNGK